MSRKTENTGFVCRHCGKTVLPLDNGSFRNHCPFCLHSLHVDQTPGDRASGCGGDMEPVGVTYHSKKGYQIVHRCAKCGQTSVNRAALDCTQPDDLELIMKLIARNEN